MASRTQFFLTRGGDFFIQKKVLKCPKTEIKKKKSSRSRCMREATKEEKRRKDGEKCYGNSGPPTSLPVDRLMKGDRLQRRRSCPT